MIAATYNPFEILNLPLLRTLIREGNQHIVLQRFNWPGIRERFGFIGTPYVDESKAKKHQAQLSPREGKILNLNLDIEKLNNLVGNPQYYLFLNTFRDQQWNARILIRYQHKITTFLKSQMSVESKDSIDIHLRLEFGRLVATITGNGREAEFEVYEMIK
jgi:hypothetical protein